MDSLYPKLRAEFQAQWTPDGQILQLYNRNTRQMFRLTRNSGRVLCTLDGETWPGEDTGLDDRTIYGYLRQFAACGLLGGEQPRQPDRRGDRSVELSLPDAAHRPPPPPAVSLQRPDSVAVAAPAGGTAGGEFPGTGSACPG